MWNLQPTENVLLQYVAKQDKWRARAVPHYLQDQARKNAKSLGANTFYGAKSVVSLFYIV